MGKKEPSNQCECKPTVGKAIVAVVSTTTKLQVLVQHKDSKFVANVVAVEDGRKDAVKPLSIEVSSIAIVINDVHSISIDIEEELGLVAHITSLVTQAMSDDD